MAASNQTLLVGALRNKLIYYYIQDTRRLNPARIQVETMGNHGWWSNTDRFYSYDAQTFTKRELLESERRLNWKGETIRAPWTTERLQNEYNALNFIAANTTIPVPKILRFERVWGAYQLVMERVNGRPLDSIKNKKAQALLNTERFMATVVLPQLQSLKSCQIGSLAGIVIPPASITAHDKRQTWPAKVAKTPQFCFCHNDLAQHNILINEETLEVEAIIDWEHSGFYTPDFEIALWRKGWNEPGYHNQGAEQVEDLIRFLLDAKTS